MGDGGSMWVTWVDDWGFWMDGVMAEEKCCAVWVRGESRGLFVAMLILVQPLKSRDWVSLFAMQKGGVY